jgi:hypothetical protein
MCDPREMRCNCWTAAMWQRLYFYFLCLRGLSMPDGVLAKASCVEESND